MHRPEKELHTHNSIPGYFDNADEGCRLCQENLIIDKYDKWIASVDTERAIKELQALEITDCRATTIMLRDKRVRELRGGNE